MLKKSKKSLAWTDREDKIIRGAIKSNPDISAKQILLLLPPRQKPRSIDGIKIRMSKLIKEDEDNV